MIDRQLVSSKIRIEQKNTGNVKATVRKKRMLRCVKPCNTFYFAQNFPHFHLQKLNCKKFYAYMRVVLYSLSCVQLFCNPRDQSPPGSFVHGIFQARILEWVAISFSRGSFQTRDQTRISCFVSGFFTAEPTGKPTCMLVDKNLVFPQAIAASPSNCFFHSIACMTHNCTC